MGLAALLFARDARDEAESLISTTLEVSRAPADPWREYSVRARRGHFAPRDDKDENRNLK
jgi:hypothetical protein